MRRSDTVKPTSPAFGFAPRPVAPSSRISPPEPVAAPGNGEIAVGWLCVSTLPRMCARLARGRGTRRRRRGRTARRRCPRRPPRCPCTPTARRPARRLGRALDPLEQRALLLLAVDVPLGVEDLVAAVLAVRLREHHQLDVGRIAAELAVARDQILDLVVGEREPEPLARLAQRRRAPSVAELRRTPSGRGAPAGATTLREIALARDHALGHPIRRAARRSAATSIASPTSVHSVRALDPRDRGRARRRARCRSPSTTTATPCRGAARSTKLTVSTVSSRRPAASGARPGRTLSIWPSCVEPRRRRASRSVDDEVDPARVDRR